MPTLKNKLASLKEKNRFRSCSLAAGIDLSSNDYLGLKDHPSLRIAAMEAIDRGVCLGAGGSRLLRGHCKEHCELEAFAADHYGFERALYFANGFQANHALFTTLPSRHDLVLYDSLVHASVRDALNSKGIKSVKIPHNDLNAFEEALKKFQNQAETIYIAVESLYSMDGDFAPLKELYDLAVCYGAILVIDEAHSTGVYGAEGRGLCDVLSKENLIVLHTCGKALGVAGGLICASAEIIDYLVNAARPFIYSTAPPPLQAYLTMKAIEICSGPIGEERRAALQRLCLIAQKQLGGEGSPIVPVILGEDGCAVQASEKLQAAGYDIRAIRPPTVPEGTSRLRLSLHADLEEQTLLDVIEMIKKAI